MYLWWSLCTLYLHACQVRVTVGDSGLCYYYYWSLLYSAILLSRADSLRSHVILHEWIAFYIAFLNIHRSGVLTALAWLVPQESAARESQSRRVLCTPYNHAPCHFMQIHIRKVYACLAVTCHLFDLLCLCYVFRAQINSLVCWYSSFIVCWYSSPFSLSCYVFLQTANYRGTERTCGRTSRTQILKQI